MNCEQVEELLSTYLDNALAPAERREVAIHLQACTKCSALLAEFRQNDILLSRLPRISPHPALRERIFSSPELLELTGTTDKSADMGSHWTQPHIPGASVIHSGYARRTMPGRPQLVALPGGRNTAPHPTIEPARESSNPGKRRRKLSPVMAAAIAALLLIAILTAGLLGRSLLLQRPGISNQGGITPPASGPQSLGPLAAGMRFAFLRDGALWSTLADGNTAHPERLTPTNVTVAAGWVVSPTMPGHMAGDMLAYIDLQKALVHTIRSDGQQDTVIGQSLLKADTAPSTVWDTSTGAFILNSLAWSKDGSMLAFVGDPQGIGQTNLYLYSTQTGKVQKVSPSLQGGAASRPIWSPDGTRLAFEFTQNGAVSIFDYNTQNLGVLDITNLPASQGTSANGVLTLDWSPDVNAPAITWSLGSIGHIRSLWIHHVGMGGTLDPQQLLAGDYVQAIYSRTGNGAMGSWMLVMDVSGQAGDIWRIDISGKQNLVQLSQGKQVGFAQWSPDGTHVAYLAAVSAGVGTAHIVSTITGTDIVIANGVAAVPAPAWSTNSQELAYSTGKQVAVINLATGKQETMPGLQGTATDFAWSVSAPHQLVVALSDERQGIYLVDTQRLSTLQLDKISTDSSIQWSEIP